MATLATAHVHIIAKADTTEHHARASSPASLPPLDNGLVRARSLLLGLTSNNMAYATNGARWHWWDAYAVPADLPAPFNDQEKYGIVPCWGYGEVLESRIPGLDVGRLIFGFWPSSQLPVDLQLVPAAGVKDHWIDVAPQRENVMNLYRRFVLADAILSAASLDDEKASAEMARRANMRVQYEAGYLLNAAVFGESPVHPLGERAGEWSAGDADLREAVVVSLSGSGRTARSFTDSVFHGRRPASEPLAFLAITSNPTANVFRQPPIRTKLVGYSEMISSETLVWISSQQPKKIVVVDFGGRDNAFDALFSRFEAAFPDTNVTAIGVGAEAKAHTADDVDKFAKRNALSNRTMMNTTVLRDAMMKRLGEEEYFRGLEESWSGFLERGCVDDLVLSVRKGVEGSTGFEGGWEELAQGKLRWDEARVYWF